MSPDLVDRLLIRDLLENWALWRDSGDWDRFASLWHPDGVMMATWQQSPAADFIAGCKLAWSRGLRVIHSLAGTTIDVAGDRAIAQTRMTIHQRAEVHGALVDVACTGRFYDFLVRVDDRWRLLLRQPIYERDRMDAVDPAKVSVLDDAVLARFPEGYRHLAYLQTLQGFTVKRDMPGFEGEPLDRLYARGQAWLADGTAPIGECLT